MNLRLPILGFGLFLSVTAAGMACSVPVFRYALERWERDLFQVIVVKNGAFTEEEVARAQGLQDATVLREGHLNAKVSLADISGAAMRETLVGMYPEAADLAGEMEGTVTLFYPSETQDRRVIWHASFTDEAVMQLRKGAAVEPLVTALLGGASTVFVLLESGDSSKDNAAFQLVRESAAKLEQTLEIPEGIISTEGEVTGGRLTAEEARAEDPSNQLKSGIPLKIAFETIRLPKGEAPSVFRSILLQMEDAMLEEGDLHQPMVFPVFGRGRVLPPMIGEAINHENMESAAQYLCGACSCQMKAQNPGMDSLTAIDWAAYLDGSEVIQAREVPALSGFLPDGGNAETVLSHQKASESPPSKAPSGTSALLRNVLIAGGALFGALLAGSFFLSRSRLTPN